MVQSQQKVKKRVKIKLSVNPAFWFIIALLLALAAIAYGLWLPGTLKFGS